MDNFSFKNLRSLTHKKLLLIAIHLFLGHLIISITIYLRTNYTIIGSLVSASLITIVYGTFSSIGILLLNSQIKKSQVARVTFYNGFFTLFLGSNVIIFLFCFAGGLARNNGELPVAFVIAPLSTLFSFAWLPLILLFFLEPLAVIYASNYMCIKKLLT